MESTTVEILSTSKGHNFPCLGTESTTVEILSTSKGPSWEGYFIAIYNSRNS